MKITNKFDNGCTACGEIAWAGEKVYFNPQGEKGQKIRHEKCGEFPKTEPVEVPIVSLKQCKVCGEEKPLSEYYKHKSTKDRLRIECKACGRAANKEWALKRIEAKAAKPAPVVVLEGDKAIADKLGITVQALNNMPYGQVQEYLAMAERLENLRKGVL